MMHRELMLAGTRELWINFTRLQMSFASESAEKKAVPEEVQATIHSHRLPLKRQARCFSDLDTLLFSVFWFATIDRDAQSIEKFRLFLLACQPMQHCAAPLWRNRILVEGSSSFPKPSQPSFPFRTELGFHLFAQSLSEGPTMTGG